MYVCFLHRLGLSPQPLYQHFQNFQRISQAALQAYFGRCPALRVEPSLEVSQESLVLDLGLLDDDGNRLSAADVIDPIILSKNTKPLGHGFVQRVARRANGRARTRYTTAPWQVEEVGAYAA
jgi:hypothetical protein